MPTTIQGIWLPLITPFRDGEVDEVSLRRLLRHYDSEPIDGIVLAATTGEAMTLDDDEIFRIVTIAREETSSHTPLWLGLSGSDTRKLIKLMARVESWPVDGYLIACPYYNRPSQEGMFRHFTTLAGATARPVMIYNIPYRTGVNLGNETMLRLASVPNIVGVKDCCADAMQSFDLTRDRPPGFAVMTGEDAFFHAALGQGADGGILASAHIDPGGFAHVRDLYRKGQTGAALTAWRALAPLPRLLFTEPSPGPIKHWLWRMGLIDSPEMRLPMAAIGAGLAGQIDARIKGWVCTVPDFTR